MEKYRKIKRRHFRTLLLFKGRTVLFVLQQTVKMGNHGHIYLRYDTLAIF